jgi:cytochrome c oxidase cbb3-type subunit 4
LSTLLIFIAFSAICLWAYSAKRKPQFDEAAKLPFADEIRPQQGGQA